MKYLLAFALSFVSVFLKGFQHKNVQGEHMKSIFIVSYLMAIFDVLIIGLIAKHGEWNIAFATGGGAALGMVISIKLHRKIYGN